MWLFLSTNGSNKSEIESTTHGHCKSVEQQHENCKLLQQER